MLRYLAINSGILRFLDEFDCLTDRFDLLGGIIGNVDVELFFQLHYQLDCVERISAQVVHERSFRGNLFFVDAELGSHDVDDSLLN